MCYPNSANIQHNQFIRKGSATFIMRYTDEKIGKLATFNKKFPVILKEERELLYGERGKSALAENLGVHRNTIALWEKGTNMPTLEELLKICNIFNCELGYLLGEMNGKTRKATDIQAETGLSEQSQAVLNQFNENVLIDVTGVINCFLSTEEQAWNGKWYSCFLELASKMQSFKSAELDAENDDEDTKAGYLYQIQNLIMKIVESYVKGDFNNG
jgi:transcriptional regulator with XRE-family HTH domain